MAKYWKIIKSSVHSYIGVTRVRISSRVWEDFQNKVSKLTKRPKYFSLEQIKPIGMDYCSWSFELKSELQSRHFVQILITNLLGRAQPSRNVLIDTSWISTPTSNSWLIVTSSVTRFDDFWKFFAKNYVTKVAQIIYVFWAIFKQISFYVKTCFGYFFGQPL